MMKEAGRILDTLVLPRPWKTSHDRDACETCLLGRPPTRSAATDCRGYWRLASLISLWVYLDTHLAAQHAVTLLSPGARGVNSISKRHFAAPCERISVLEITT